MGFTALSDRKNYEFPPATVDVRGWEVRTGLDDEDIGKVDDVIVDDADTPRYLDVDLGLFKKHVLIPLGRARADGTQDIVWVTGMTARQFEVIPKYEGDPQKIGDDYEGRLRDAYESARTTGDDFSNKQRLRDEELSRSGGRLADIDDLDDIAVAGHSADPRGWEVFTSDGREIGKVKNLIVDTAASKVRYLETALDRKVLDLDDDRRTLVPAEAARLERSEKKVVLDGLTAADATSFPAFDGLPLANDAELTFREPFEAARKRDAGESGSRQEAGRFFESRSGRESSAESRENPDRSQALAASGRDPDRAGEPGGAHGVGDSDVERFFAPRREQAARRFGNEDTREGELRAGSGGEREGGAIPTDRDTHRDVDRGTERGTTRETRHAGARPGDSDEEVTIHLRGDDIVVERHRPER